jgi:5'-methylthioadenosine phosphorylase
VHTGGTYLVMDGPQFSTRAESLLYRAWGVDVIGMTNMPEAKLAREAELPYATIALATDYDCWRESEAPVTVEMVRAVLAQNVLLAQDILRRVIEILPDPAQSPASTALKNAILTAPDHFTAAARRKLGPLCGRYLRAGAP